MHCLKRLVLFYSTVSVNSSKKKATDRSRTEIMNAVDMRPQEVRVVDTCGGGEIVVMSPEKVEVGWTIEVRPGDLIPLDGTILEGETRVNTAPVTGEPVPVRAEPGTQLMSGCINETGRITMRVDKVLEDPWLLKFLMLLKMRLHRNLKSINSLRALLVYILQS